MGKDVVFSHRSIEWATPQYLFDELNEEFRFTLDPCATEHNAKCAKFYTKEQDGLFQDWTGETVFCNPPYGKEVKPWVIKCLNHAYRGGGTAVMLIPARTDTKVFHDYIYHHAEIRFIKGRLTFGGSKNVAPFPSMVVVYRQVRVNE